MALDLADYENKTKEAIQAFWGNREKARQKQIEAGTGDQGERGSVTAGKNMDGFIALVIDLVKANGLAHADIHHTGPLVTLPGFFRPTKQWDLVVVHQRRLIAAIELKSQVGSFGNNFNNRAEEAIGSAYDLWTAYHQKAFGEQPEPFVGWMMVVEDAPESRREVQVKSLHFPAFQQFQKASYLNRYDILCQRLVRERLYTSASVIGSPRSGETTGEFSDISEMTGLKTFITALAGHVATEAARRP